MNKKAKTRSAVSLAVTFCLVLALAFSFPLYFAKAETDPLQDNGTSENSSSSAVPDDNSSSESSSGSPQTSAPEPSRTDTVKVILNFNGGTGGSTVLYPPYGTKVEDLATPVRKGYKFAGWVSGGNNIMPNFKIEDEISLTAQWEKIESKSSKTESSSKSPSTSYKPVDTHQSDVNAAASNAQAAVSDPDVLSSQNWSGIFSSGESSQASSGAAVAGLVSSKSGGDSSGGNSWLFIAGIALIVLAACGIGLFIYLQFFHTQHNSKGNGKNDINYDMDDTIDIDSFTDISSDSSGTPQRINIGKPDNKTRPAVMSDSAVKSEALKNSKPKARISAAPSAENTPASPKAQAKPVDGAKSDFDWDKFFNDDDI